MKASILFFFLTNFLSLNAQCSSIPSEFIMLMKKSVQQIKSQESDTLYFSIPDEYKGNYHIYSCYFKFEGKILVVASFEIYFGSSTISHWYDFVDISKKKTNIHAKLYRQPNFSKSVYRTYVKKIKCKGCR